MRSGDDLEVGLRKHMGALRSSLPPPIDLDRQIVRAIGAAQSSHRLSLAHQFVLTGALLIFVVVILAGVSVLRRSGVVSPAVTPPSKPSLVATPSPTASSDKTPLQWPAARIAFLNPEIGVIAYDGAIKLTVDGAKSWRIVQSGAFVRHLQWLDEHHVIAATVKGLLSSGDGGFTWSLMTQQTDLSSIDFTSLSTGFAVRHGQLLRTTDGGRSFTLVATGIKVQAVTFVDLRRGWVAGPEGIAMSTDGGESWSRQATFDFSRVVSTTADIGPYNLPAWSIRFADDIHGFVLYALPDTTMSQRASYVFYTSNGGQQWKFQSYEHFFPVPPSLPSSAGSTPANVIGDVAVTGPASGQLIDSDLAGAQGVFLARTSDGGQTWKDVPLPSEPHAIAIGGQIQVMGDREWVIWTDGLSTNLLVSLDGGRTWAPVRH